MSVIVSHIMSHMKWISNIASAFRRRPVTIRSPSFWGFRAFRRSGAIGWCNAEPEEITHLTTFDPGFGVGYETSEEKDQTKQQRKHSASSCHSLFRVAYGARSPCKLLVQETTYPPNDSTVSRVSTISTWHGPSARRNRFLFKIGWATKERTFV